MHTVIAITGHSKSGKDFFALMLAHALRAMGLNVRTFAFADPLKEIASAYLRIPRDLFDTHHGKDTAIRETLPGWAPPPASHYYSPKETECLFPLLNTRDLDVWGDASTEVRSAASGALNAFSLQLIGMYCDLCAQADMPARLNAPATHFLLPRKLPYWLRDRVENVGFRPRDALLAFGAAGGIVDKLMHAKGCMEAIMWEHLRGEAHVGIITDMRYEHEHAIVGSLAAVGMHVTTVRVSRPDAPDTRAAGLATHITETALDKVSMDVDAPLDELELTCPEGASESVRMSGIPYRLFDTLMQALSTTAASPGRGPLDAFLANNAEKCVRDVVNLFLQDKYTQACNDLRMPESGLTYAPGVGSHTVERLARRTAHELYG